MFGSSTLFHTFNKIMWQEIFHFFCAICLIDLLLFLCYSYNFFIHTCAIWLFIVLFVIYSLYYFYFKGLLFLIMPCHCIYLAFVFALTQNFSAKGLQFSNPVVNFHHYLTEFTVTFEVIFQPLWISLFSWIMRFHGCLFFFPLNYSVPVSYVGSSS